MSGSRLYCSRTLHSTCSHHCCQPPPALLHATHAPRTHTQPNTAALQPAPPPRGIGRPPIYVDLEAEPKIDAAHPPDLKPHADAIEPPPKEDEPAASSSSAASSASNLAAAAAAAGAAAGAGAAKAAKAAKKGGGSKAAAPAQQSEAARHIALTNVVTRTDELVELVRAALGARRARAATAWLLLPSSCAARRCGAQSVAACPSVARSCAQVSRALLGKSAAEAVGADSYALRRLRADVQMQLTAFKNAAYTAGYTAGKDEVVAFATNRYR